MNYKVILAGAFAFALCFPASLAFAQQYGNGSGGSGGDAGSQGSGGYHGGSGGGTGDTGTTTPPTGDTGTTTPPTGGGSTTGGSGSGGSSGGGAGGGGSSSHGGGKPGGETAGNNLSFPVVAADGFSIADIAGATFTTPYTGPYTNLSAEELAALSGYTWFAQKTTGNVWQATHTLNPTGLPIDVYGIDWGDNVESVNPLVGQPFRIEITPYVKPNTTMIGYTMNVLANPSSPDEIQGTNDRIYESSLATVVSSRPQLLIQYLGTAATSTLVWSGTMWTGEGSALPETAIAFGPELNVAGKYVYGASTGGWRPVQTGAYRLTFLVPSGDISLKNAVIGNIADWTATATTTTEETETGAATPVVDASDNLSYVDVTVVSGRSGSGGSSSTHGGGEGEVSSSSSTDASGTMLTGTSDTTSEPSALAASTAVAPTCTYLTDQLGTSKGNNPTEVSLLQKFLNSHAGANLPVTGYFGSQTYDAVKKFQTTYPDEILQPWIDAGNTDVSLTEGTGYVGVTTLAKINDLSCE